MMGARSKINAISLNVKINKLKSVHMRGYKLPIKVQNIMQKDWAQAIISLKVVGGLLFWPTPCTVWVKKSQGFSYFFRKRLGIVSVNFTHLLCIPIYARLQMFIQLPATLTRLCHIKRDYPVHIICLKCPSAKTHAGWSDLLVIWHNFTTVGDN